MFSRILLQKQVRFSKKTIVLHFTGGLSDSPNNRADIKPATRKTHCGEKKELFGQKNLLDWRKEAIVYIAH